MTIVEYYPVSPSTTFVNFNRHVKRSYYHIAARFVDVKDPWACQSALTPAETSLLTHCTPSKAEALGASSSVVRRKTERAFFTLIALSSDDQFLGNHVSQDENGDSLLSLSCFAATWSF